MNLNSKHEPSAGYILAGLCSFIFSGLGQLLLGRIWSAISLFFIEIIIWVFIICDLDREMGFALALLFLFINRVLSAYFASNGHRISMFAHDDDDIK